MREVRVRLDSGKVIRILSNDLDAPAAEIADLYKRRWRSSCSSAGQADPQNPPLSRTSENAVRIQIAVALIAFLLLRLAQTAQRAVTSPLAFARLSHQPDTPRLDRLLNRAATPFNPSTRSNTRANHTVRSVLDEVHIAQFAALLRTLSKEHRRQVIIAVHDRQLFDYLSLELSPAFAGDELITIELVDRI